jgi:hypothetical protein
VSLTRLCPFCLEPAVECLCDVDEPAAGSVSGMSDDDKTGLDPAVLADAVRESGIALRPGDVLAVRLPLSCNRADLKQARDYGLAVERETGIKVAFIPGEEFAATTVNITVNGLVGDQATLAAEIRKVMAEETGRYLHRNGGIGIA